MLVRHALRYVPWETTDLLSPFTTYGTALKALSLLRVSYSEKNSMETAYKIVNGDNQVLNNRVHSLEDDLKKVKRELQEAKDKLSEEIGIEEGSGRPRTESVSLLLHIFIHFLCFVAYVLIMIVRNSEFFGTHMCAHMYSTYVRTYVHISCLLHLCMYVQMYVHTCTCKNHQSTSIIYVRRSLSMHHNSY